MIDGIWSFSSEFRSWDSHSVQLIRHRHLCFHENKHNKYGGLAGPKLIRVKEWVTLSEARRVICTFWVFNTAKTLKPTYRVLFCLFFRLTYFTVREGSQILWDTPRRILMVTHFNLQISFHSLFKTCYFISFLDDVILGGPMSNNYSHRIILVTQGAKPFSLNRTNLFHRRLKITSNQ